MQRVLGFCPACRGYFKNPSLHRSKTNYSKEELNWCYSCVVCKKDTDEYWEEMQKRFGGYF